MNPTDGCAIPSHLVLPNWQQGIPPVQAEVLAAKFQALSELRYPEIRELMIAEPRLSELLWFLQWISHKPGGLEKFTHALLSKYPNQIGTAVMQKIGWKWGHQYSVEDCLAILSSLSPQHRCSKWRDGDWAAEILIKDPLGAGLTSSPPNQETAKKLTIRLTPEHFWTVCAEVAMRAIPSQLAAWCNHSDSTFNCRAGLRWGERLYFNGLMPALLQMMDDHAKDSQRVIANTKVSAKVFEELDYGLAQRTPVTILGDTRFGKTTAAKAWCEMRPGLARLITVPESNRDWDFFAAHADALGIGYGPTTPLHCLKRAVEYVLRQSGLFLVYDEAHFLFPKIYSANTPPHRLDWLRCQVIDHDLGCGLFATRQTYTQTMSQFCRKTGFAMDQFLGRMDKPLVLLEEPDLKDLIAVAQVKFPQISPILREYLVNCAVISQGYLGTLELLGNRAIYLAKKDGRSEVTEVDIDAAFDRNFSSANGAGNANTRPLQGIRKAPVKRVQRRIREVGIDPASQEAGDRTRFARIPAPGSASIEAEDRPVEASLATA